LFVLVLMNTQFVSKRGRSIIEIKKKRKKLNLKGKNNKINKMSEKDDFRMQLC